MYNASISDDINSGFAFEKLHYIMSLKVTALFFVLFFRFKSWLVYFYKSIVDYLLVIRWFFGKKEDVVLW